MAATSGGLALLLTIFLFNGVYSQIPDKRLCADSSCKGVISFAVIKESYIAKNDQELSLNAGSQVVVTSKNVQGSDEYWGGEINGKHGYFPASYVQEQKVFNTNPKIVVSTQTTDSNDFSDMAKAYDEMTKANANQGESNGAPPPVASQSTDPPKPTGGVEETEEEEEGEEGDDEYEDEEGDEEGDEGDEEGEEEEEGDETEEPGTQPDDTEAANDPTEVTEQGQTAEGTKPETTKPVDAMPAETKPEEKQAEAAESAIPAPQEANGGLLSSIGSMFGGMFGGKEEASPDVALTDSGPKEPEAAEQPSVPATDEKEAEKSETPEGKAGAVDPTEAAETGAPAEEEEGVDDRLRTIQEEQLAKIRNNFLRRRTQASATKEEVDDINKLLEKKYKRMEEPIQRIRAPSMIPTDGGSTVHAEIPRPDPEKLKENLAAQQAQINKELEQKKPAELDRQWEIELERRKQEELRKAQEKLIHEETARKIQEEAVKKAKEEAAKKAQEEAVKKAQEEAAKKAREEAAKKAQEEAVKKAQIESANKAQEEAVKKAQEEAVKKVQEEAAKKVQEEAAKKAQEEAAKKAQEEALKKTQEEATKKAQEEAAKKAQEEAVKKAQEDAVKKAQEEAARKAQEEAAKKAQEEAAKKAQEEAVKKAQEEAVKKAQEAARKAQEEAAKKAQEEAAKKAQEEATKKAQEEAMKRAQEEATKKAQEEAAKKAQEEAVKKAQEEAARKAQEVAKKAQEDAAKKVELEMQAAKLRDEQRKQEELQKQKQQQAELLHRQEEMRREKEIQRKLQKQQKAPETRVHDGGRPVVASNQHPPLASTQPGNVPANPASAMPTTREGAEPNQQSIVDDMALPHGSTTGKGSGETPEVQVTEALTRPPATVSMAASTTPSVSPVVSQQQTLSDVMATAVPTPTPPDAAGSGNHATNHAQEAQPNAGLLQPSTPTPAENIRPSVSIVPATETTQVPGNPGEGSSPGEDAEEAEEGFEEAEEGEEEEEGGEEEEGEEEKEAPTSEDNTDNAEPEKPVQPTPTKEVEEMEKTITGADGLRSVVFDGTTMPLEDEPVVAPTAVPEVVSSIPELSPSMTEQVMVATPPLEASLQATQSSPILSMSDMPSPSPSEVLSQHTAQVGGEAPSGEALTDEGVANATGPTPPNGDDQHKPTPAWEQKQGQHDPYTPGDFMSRRFLQSETVDTPEMVDNMKNEQTEESATITEPDHEPVPPTEERNEPEGQEDPTPWEDPEMVTPSAPEEEPLPPTDAEDFDFVTPPTVTEEEEQQDAPIKEPEPEQQQPEQAATEAGGGVVGNFVGALDGALKFLDPLVIGIVAIMPSSVANFLEHEPFGFSAPRAALISIFSFSFLTMGIISYCMALCGGKRRDPLAKVSALEDKLFVASKERDDLLQTVDKMKIQIEESKNRSTMSEGGVQELKSKLQTVQLHMAALQNTSTEQEMKIKELTGQNAEYAEVVTAKDGQLEQYMYQVNQYSEQLNTTNTQLQESWQAQVVAQEQTASYQVQVEQLTEEVTFLTESKDQLQLQLEGWSEKVTELSEEIKVLTEQQKENEKLLAFKDSEMEVMRDCFLQLKAMQGAVTEGGDADNEDVDQADGDSPEVQEKIKAMMDVSKVNASLKEVTEERDTLKQRLQIEIDARKEMEDDMEKKEKEIENLREGHRQAEVQSQEATTKLNVLASYFKEKEVELQTSLGEQVVKSKESQNQLTGFDDKVKRTEEEMASYRAQVDDLKKEIENVERDFRAQVATNEKKAHENWLAARQAERDLKEAKNEAAMLRQKLLDMERKQELSGPAGLIRPLPTRAMPPPGVNGPPPPGMMPLGPPPMGPSPHAMGDRPMSRGTGIPPSPHMRDDHDYIPPPMRGRPPMMMDRPPPPPGSRGSPPPGWSPAGRGRSPPPFDRRSPPFDRRSPPPFDRRSPPPFDRRGSPPPFDRRGPPPPHDRRSPPPMFRGPPPPDRRGPPPPGYRSPDGGYRRTPPHGRPYPPDQPPPPEYRKGGLDPRASDLRMMDPRTSSPYERPSSSASRNTDVPPHRNSQNMI